MAEQRPMFRFRLPWMLSSAPAPPPTATQSPPRATTTEASSTTPQPQANTEPKVNPITPARRPFRLQHITPASPPPPKGQTLPVTSSQSPAQVNDSTITPSNQPTLESQRPSEPITTTPIPTVPAQAPPLWSPRRSAAQDPVPGAEVSPKPKSQPQISDQPKSPGTHSQASSKLPASSVASPQFSATSQLASPSLTSPQSSATSQPPSPWRRLPQEQNASQLPSRPPTSPLSVPQSSSPTPQPNDPSRPLSPNHPQIQKSSQTEKFDQPKSPSKLDFQSLNQTSLGTSSPTLTTTNVQPTGRTEIQPPSPLVRKTLSPVSIEPSLAVSQLQPLEAQSKTETRPNVATKSPTQGTIPPTGTVGKPQDLTGPLEATTPPLQMAKEMSPKQRKSYDTMTESLAMHLTETSGTSTRNAEQLSVASEAEQRQLNNQVMVQQKEAPTSKTSNQHEKQTKTMTLRQTDNKRTATGSRRKPMISNGSQFSFQKEIRNDIYKLAGKMSIESPEILKDGGPLTVVALVGKNRGASMQLGIESIKKESFSGHKDYNIKPGENAEGKKTSKHKRSKPDINKEDQVTKAHVNSNIQDINNSILMNSLISERNPGVHLALFHNPTEPTMPSDKTRSLEERKGKSILPLPRSFSVDPPSKGDP